MRMLQAHIKGQDSQVDTMAVEEAGKMGGTVAAVEAAVEAVAVAVVVAPQRN